jgi:hypothetical protein
LVALDDYRHACNDVLVMDGDSYLRRLRVFSGEGDFRRGAVSGFVGGFDLEFAGLG